MNFFQFSVRAIAQSYMSKFRIILTFEVTGPRSKVTPGSDHDIAQVNHGRNMHVKFELLPLLWLKRYSPDKLASP